MLGQRVRCERGWWRIGRGCDPSHGGHDPGCRRNPAGRRDALAGGRRRIDTDGFSHAHGHATDDGGVVGTRSGKHDRVHSACEETRRKARRRQGARQEGRDGRRGELRRRHVRERREAKDLVSPGPARSQRADPNANEGPARVSRSRVTGIGLGLRWEFLEELAELARAGAVPIDFLEVSPENYMGRGGSQVALLEELGERWPVVTHGLTLSLGGMGPLDAVYLRDLAAFVRRVGTPWHSDHMCFGAVDGRVLHELLPIPWKRANVMHVADRIRRAQDVLGVPLAVENITTYWHPGRAEMEEPEFVARVCEAADCGLLLDVNNAYVNAQNFGWDVDAWMRSAPLERVVQIHVAGHEWFAVDERGLGKSLVRGEEPLELPGQSIIVDTHGADVCDPVLALLGRVLERTGPVPVLLERDQNVPPLDALLGEIQRIREVCEGG
jgi:uncharacterized protein (UPF0276 family)